MARKSNEKAPVEKPEIKAAADAAQTGEGGAQTSSSTPDPTQDATGGEVGNASPSPETPTEKAPPDKPNSKSTRVRVICDGTLGPKLLEKGDITDDPEYVALLEVKGQRKVEAVK
ncbi:MAG: hypothetical protein Q8K46_05240 [Deltaproteobacteria bacterium]|nr:hypothetical protein [Deltaproteobacteria bacterium]